MDAFDLFKKLASGAKFNKNRFRSDAEKLGVGYKHVLVQNPSFFSSLYDAHADNKIHSVAEKKG